MTSLPRVDIIYGYADAQPTAVNAVVKDGAKGIIYAGMGNGNFNAPVGIALENASKDGVVVCRSARAGAGRVTLFNEVEDQKLGFVVADDPNPQKARVLLMLALTQTSDFNKIQQIFFAY